jgi:hypothetical protein
MISSRRLNSALALFGINPRETVQSLAAFPGFVRDHRAFARLRKKSDGKFPAGKLYPCLGDRHEAGGVAKGHYFHQDMLVARRIYERCPRRHVDVGSRVDGFVAHVAVFREIEVFDIRSVVDVVHNVKFTQIDIMKPTADDLKRAYDSVSCLHTLEHFGLGRYGDDLDYYGHQKGLASIAQLLCSGGILYLSVPMGVQRIEFNAHRVFSLSYLLEMCRPEFECERFSYVDDQGALFENAAVDTPEALRSYDCTFGLAILELRKK